MNFDTEENGGKKCFSCKTKASMSCILVRRMCLWCQIIHVCLFWQTIFHSKENGKKSFSYETKACMLCIPMTRRCLSCPKTEGKKDYYKNPCLSFLMDELWFHKKWWKKVSLAKPRHKYFVSQQRECVYGTLKQQERRLLQESMFISFNGWTLILNRIVEKKLFLGSQSMNIVLPIEENVFVVSNSRGKNDYCKNQCLSFMAEELWFKGKR